MTVQTPTKPHTLNVTLSADEQSVNNKLVTGEELLAMGDIGRTELVKGEIVYLMPTGHSHGFIEFNIGGILRDFVRKHQLGRVLGGEVGVYTQRNPDTVRGIDVAYISHERFAKVQSSSYLDVAPELIVEIMSPDDKWTDINDKLNEYFDIGVQIIWVVNPKRHQIHVYHSLTKTEILDAEDTLTGGEILPGFSVSVAELFAS